MVSNTFVEEVFKQETDEAFIVLLTLDHEAITEPIRVCSNAENIESNGETFLAFPFEITLPASSPDQPPRAALRIDNVDQRISEAIRAISTAPSVKIQVVRASEPNTIEMELDGFKFESITYDALTVTGDLTVENFLNEPYPAGRFDPSRFPGVF